MTCDGESPERVSAQATEPRAGRVPAVRREAAVTVGAIAVAGEVDNGLIRDRLPSVPRNSVFSARKTTLGSPSSSVYARKAFTIAGHNLRKR